MNRKKQWEIDAARQIREGPIFTPEGPIKCSASWPADSSFWKFDKCKQPADGIYLENDKRMPFCELHGRYKKLVAKF